MREIDSLEAAQAASAAREGELLEMLLSAENIGATHALLGRNLGRGAARERSGA